MAKVINDADAEVRATTPAAKAAKAATTTPRRVPLPMTPQQEAAVAWDVVAKAATPQKGAGGGSAAGAGAAAAAAADLKTKPVPAGTPAKAARVMTSPEYTISPTHVHYASDDAAAAATAVVVEATTTTVDVSSSSRRAPTETDSPLDGSVTGDTPLGVVTRSGPKRATTASGGTGGSSARRRPRATPPRTPTDWAASRATTKATARRESTGRVAAAVSAALAATPRTPADSASKPAPRRSARLSGSGKK
eukprot:31060-Pelagococcus_subviridis.AAC.1